MNAFHIAGLGTALPPHVAVQTEAAALAPHFAHADGRRAKLLNRLYRRSGVETRRSVSVRGGDGSLAERIPWYPLPASEADLGPTTRDRMQWYAQEAPPLAEAAAAQALERSGFGPEEITHLVTVSCTGFASPGVEHHLIERLGISRGVARTHVGFMGCHGALNGLRAAHGYAAAPEATVLLCAVELCSLHFAYGWDEEMLVANTLFADGAAALVGRGTAVEGAGPTAPTVHPAPGGVSAPDGAATTPWRVAASGTFFMPESTDAMTWTIGDHGFRMTLSAAVPDAIGRHLRPWLTEWLGGHGLSLDQVASWAVHPGGPRILDAVESALDLGPQALCVSRETLRDHGNMSSPTVLFILERMMRESHALPCVALAFGPGLVVEAALIV